MQTYLSSDLSLENNLPRWTSDSSCNYNGSSLNFRLGLAHDNCVLFETSEFSLIHGKITGLVGTNGSGKTSLAKVIASKELPGFPQDLTVECVNSHEIEDDSQELSQLAEEYLEAKAAKSFKKLSYKIEKLENCLEITEFPEDIEKFSDVLADLYEKQDTLQSNATINIQQMLLDLEFEKYGYCTKKMSELSCGWRYKCKLAAALIVPPDLLIIDEPSFLDSSSVEWFVRTLKHIVDTYHSMIVLISHKECLLETLCDRILFVNSGNCSLRAYNCGYEIFRTVHLVSNQHADKVISSYRSKVTTAEKSLLNINAKLEKREATFKKATSENADKRFIKGKNKEAKQKACNSIHSKVKQLQQQVDHIKDIEHEAKREAICPLHITGVISATAIATLSNVSFSYSPFDAVSIFRNLSVRLEAQDRVILRGANGCGKSTLLKLITGELQPATGIVQHHGQVLYFPQNALDALALYQETAVSYLVTNNTEASKPHEATDTKIRQHLARFGLRNNMVVKGVSALSTGQRVRLWLAKQLYYQPNPCVLIFDEITENLDVETKASLTDVLNTFIGASIVVSHDIDTYKKFQFTQIWNVTSEGFSVEYV